MPQMVVHQKEVAVHQKAEHQKAVEEQKVVAEQQVVQRQKPRVE